MKANRRQMVTFRLAPRTLRLLELAAREACDTKTGVVEEALQGYFWAQGLGAEAQNMPPKRVVKARKKGVKV